MKQQNKKYLEQLKLYSIGSETEDDFWEKAKRNLADYVTKHHTIWYHRTMRPRYVKSTKKDTETSKDR